jgi:capsular polysaccharide export protein
MNVYCIGYYDKFSRFFLGIKKELKKKYPNLKFKISSLYWGGFLYSYIRITTSSLISFKAWINVCFNKRKYLKIVKNNLPYKNIILQDIIKFHTKLNKNVSEKHLLLQAISYIDIISKEFITFKPDIVLLIGDSRMALEITKIIAETFNIKTYFIEQGPFNTTVFDSKGTNANASIREFNPENGKTLTTSQKELINSFTERPKRPKYKRFPLYRGIDFSLEFIISKTVLFPPDLKHTDIFPMFFMSQQKLKSIKFSKEIKTFLVILQVPVDVNMIYHSPNFKNNYSIVKALYENLPPNSQLLLREHPIYVGKYEKELYEYAEMYNLYFDTNPSLKDSIANTDVIIVNNSTVGVEAIALKKTIIVLGNSYYDNSQICIKYNKRDNLTTILKDSLNFEPNEKHIDSFLYEFFFNHLIEGHITDSDLNATKIISDRIISEFNQSQ